MSFDWKEHAECPAGLYSASGIRLNCNADRDAMIARGEWLEKLEAKHTELVQKSDEQTREVRRLEEKAERLAALLSRKLGVSGQTVQAMATPEYGDMKTALRMAEEENARLREALEWMTAPGYGLDGTETEAERAKYWAKACLKMRDQARTALAGVEK